MMRSRSGYWPSAWPVECGANHRPKTAPTSGPNLQPTDRLVATTRHTGRWPVMFVQRDRGQLYLHGTSGPEDAQVTAWVERVDPTSLQPVASSGELPAGRHEWCGSIAAHANGDLYTVSGSYVHRLDAECSVIGAAELPVDHAHNGMLILDDGSIITKDIRLGSTPSTLTVLDPELTVLASVRLPEASMGRLSAVGDTIYVPGTTRILRYRWDGAALSVDPQWSPTYRSAEEDCGLAWDTTISGDRVWLMDNGNIPAVETRFSRVPTLRPGPTPPGAVMSSRPPWSAPVRATGISVTDPDDVVRVRPTEHPSGWVIAPPLATDAILVAWDTANMGIAAFDISSTGPGGGSGGSSGGGVGDMLWFQPFRPSMQPLLYPDTGELVINDFRMLADNETSDDLVVLDIGTGRMKARVPTGATSLNGMFLCPGWDRDLYYCTSGTVARIRAESL